MRDRQRASESAPEKRLQLILLHRGTGQMWEVRVQHEGLKAYRVVRGATQQEAELKARLQVAAWNERWSNRQVVLKSRLQKIQKSWDNEANKETAQIGRAS